LTQKPQQSAAAADMSGKVAVVLAGCGVYDGTEVHEAAAVCSALTRVGKIPVFYAPSQKHYDEVNHQNADPTNETDRNVLVESARIARGKVQSISALTADDADALIIPGGFGAAKNLCNFAHQGVETADLKANEDVAAAINSFKDAGKPIGMCCIAPVLAAMVLCDKESGKSVKVTLGRTQPTADETDSGISWPATPMVSDKVKELGGEVEEVGVEEFIVDEENKLFTTPAFMCEGAAFHQVHDGIENMIKALVESISP